MEFEQFDSYEALSARAAEILLSTIRHDPRVTPVGRFLAPTWLRW